MDTLTDLAELGLLEPVTRLSRDLVKAIKDERLKLTRGDIRYLVDCYYQIQDFRKIARQQDSASKDNKEPTNLVEWMALQFTVLERDVHKTLDAWTETDPTSVWAKGLTGIGPVISAGLACLIDIEKAPTVGHIWSFFGLNPDVKWLKGKKRPWCHMGKVLAWKIGDCFCKFHNHPKCSYGKLYAERKALEVARNVALQFKDQAARTLEEKDIKDKDTLARYRSGMLPDGRIELRARRWAVKLFLSHWHEVKYIDHYGEPPPKPYILTREGGHAHEIRREDMT